MAMIFQDPLSSMHPYYTVGRQIVEAYRIHSNVSKEKADPAVESAPAHVPAFGP